MEQAWLVLMQAVLSETAWGALLFQSSGRTWHERCLDGPSLATSHRVHILSAVAQADRRKQHRMHQHVEFPQRSSEYHETQDTLHT